MLGGVHGGFLAALADQLLFIGPAVLGVEGAPGGSTVELSMQFFAPVRLDAEIEVTTEMLRNTRRLVSVRGLFEQAGQGCASFAGTLRKKL